MQAVGLCKCLCSQLLQLSWFTVQAWKQQPGRLSDIIAVHQQTLAMLGMNYGHPHPFHQRRQQEERPVGGEKKNTFSNGCGPSCQPLSAELPDTLIPDFSTHGSALQMEGNPLR